MPFMGLFENSPQNTVFTTIDEYWPLIVERSLISKERMSGAPMLVGSSLRVFSAVLLFGGRKNEIALNSHFGSASSIPE
jgi:hypothetical protein